MKIILKIKMIFSNREKNVCQVVIHFYEKKFDHTTSHNIKQFLDGTKKLKVLEQPV